MKSVGLKKLRKLIFWHPCFEVCSSFYLSFTTQFIMFAARRIATSVAPRIAFKNVTAAAAIHPSVMAPAVRSSTASIARFLNTNAIEQKRATVQRN